MKKYILYSLVCGSLLFATSYTNAANLDNGKKLYKACALCHGKVGQGIKGGTFPKIGGLPKYYLLHQHELFVKEQRFNPAMVTIGRMDKMSDEEKDDLASYVASIDIQKAAPTLRIPTYIGDAGKGEELFMDDCKSCHGKKAQGKKKKEAPPTAGQYSEYLARQINFFNNKDRWHDNDEEDEMFVDYTQQQINDILTFISTLDD